MARPNFLLASHPQVAVTSILWSRDGAPFATLIAKLEFDAATGVVVAVPRRVESDDRFEGQNPLRPLLAVGEAAPYLTHCDVVILGSVALDELSVTRDAELLLQKRAVAGAFLPLPRIGAERKHLVPAGALPQRDGDGTLRIPNELPWGYFQCAPADQRVAHLAGGERLHLRAGAESQSISPPNVRAVARVWLDQQEVPVRLLADMIVVDRQRGMVALVFRGIVSLGALSPTTIRTATTLQYAGREPEWARVVDVSPAAANTSPTATPAVEGTLTLTEGAPPPASALPFPNASRESPVNRRAAAPRITAAEVIPASAAGEQTLGLPSAPFSESESLSTTRYSDEEPAPSATPFRIAEPGTGAPTPSATPWGGAPLMRAPEAAGEETIALGRPPRSEPGAPAEARRVPPPPSTSPLRAPPPAAAFPPSAHAARTPPVAVAPAGPAPAPKAPPSPREQMEKRLRASGASEADIAILLARLAPPAAPPPDDD